MVVSSRPVFRPQSGAMKEHDYRDDVPPFDLPGIRRRLRRLQELATRFSVESLYVCQRRVPLKPDEIKAYSRAMLEAFRAMKRRNSGTGDGRDAAG